MLDSLILNRCAQRRYIYRSRLCLPSHSGLYWYRTSGYCSLTIRNSDSSFPGSRSFDMVSSALVWWIPVPPKDSHASIFFLKSTIRIQFFPVQNSGFCSCTRYSRQHPQTAFFSPSWPYPLLLIILPGIFIIQEPVVGVIIVIILIPIVLIVSFDIVIIRIKWGIPWTPWAAIGSAAWTAAWTAAGAAIVPTDGTTVRTSPVSPLVVIHHILVILVMVRWTVHSVRSTPALTVVYHTLMFAAVKRSVVSGCVAASGKAFTGSVLTGICSRKCCNTEYHQKQYCGNHHFLHCWRSFRLDTASSPSYNAISYQRSPEKRHLWTFSFSQIQCQKNTALLICSHCICTDNTIQIMSALVIDADSIKTKRSIVINNAPMADIKSIFFFIIRRLDQPLFQHPLFLCILVRRVELVSHSIRYR